MHLLNSYPMSSHPIVNVLLLVPVFLGSLAIHEFSHAWIAVKCGDLTPKRLGRLCLHPMAHADFVGTIALPAICIFFGWPFFGWAKPVPVQIQNLRRGKKDMALVALAGPLSNFLLAILATGFLAIVIRLPIGSKLFWGLRLVAVVSIEVNLMLAFFNLIPLPPLDGSMVVKGFLSEKGTLVYRRIAWVGTVVLVVMLFSGGLSILGKPVLEGARFLIALASP